MRTHKSRVENKHRSQKELEKQILRDINLLKNNLVEKIYELIQRGIDLDEVFYEMRDDEEYKVEKDQIIDI